MIVSNTLQAGGPALPVLQATGVMKSYGGVRALKGVDFALFGGEVHALCGENGSGKSTMLKILSAQIAPDSGSLAMNGHSVAMRNPVDSLAAGIAMVTQERTLVNELSVGENVLLGPRKPRSVWGIDWRATRNKAREALDVLNCDADVDDLVQDLPPGQAQLVEIARAITDDTKVLILDEPTSSLSAHEVDSLFRAMRSLRNRGVATVFISHRTQEVFEISDRLTVLRDGRLVSTGVVADYSPTRLVSDMLGRELSAFVPPPEYQTAQGAVLTVEGMSVRGKFTDVSFGVGKGEIVGIAGLVGAGHSEVLETLFGLHQREAGRVLINGEQVAIGDPPAAIKAGIGFVPGDRKIGGLVLDMSVLENAVMARTSTTARWARPRSASSVAFVEQCVEDFSIVTESLDTPVVRLSGGNQQKVLIAKWLGTNPSILLLDEPTRGVDVGAKAEIYRILLAQRDAGLSIVISSSEAPELLALCDRIIVMHAGRVAGTLHKNAADEAAIFRLAMGHE